MAKKSKAQINRMIKRAEARGDVYEPPVAPVKEPRDSSSSTTTTSAAADTQNRKEADNQEEHAKLKAARQLEQELKQIDANEDMKAKARRSAKRKAEAIASEAAGCSAAQLVEWYAKYKEEQTSSSKNTSKSKKDSAKGGSENVGNRSNNPLIAFIGQLNYTTTKESIRQHIQQSLGDEFEITEQTVHIRLLTDAKTKRSRGMAFVQVDNPELLYALLRLHQTHLEGRRINVERSAGGKANSETKKNKLEQFRNEQQEYFSGVVDKMLQEFYQQGTIQPEELDEGVIALFKRHSANVVQAALERYVESNGKQMDNPSAYLTFLVGKMAEEGIIEKSASNDHKRDVVACGGYIVSDNRSPKKPRPENDKADSILEKEGVKMNVVEGSKSNLSKIFPSYSRGRGRESKRR